MTEFPAKGLSGNTPDDLREVALAWEHSSICCRGLGEIELAERDNRFAVAMRKAADILEQHEPSH